VVNDQYPKRPMDEVEKLADELNTDYKSSTGPALTIPIPVEDIAEHYLGYSIDITNEGLFSDPNFLGGIDFEQNLIYVNASVEDHDGRYAFTVAHEIGHHVLHKEAYLNDKEQGQKEILCRDTGNKPHIEIEADRFAAALLMPSGAVLEVFNRVKPKRKVATIGQARGVASEVMKEGGFSNVSNTAMINRLIDLGAIKAPYQNGLVHKGYRESLIIRLLRGTMGRLRRLM
jgi:Zn-dependent peptidase ImmA (M78 family)